MFSFMNSINQFVSAFLTIVFTGCFSIFSLIGGTGKELPKTPDDFTPVMRFAICSDVHLNGEEGTDEAKKFDAMFKDVYEYTESCEYDKLDAVIVAGDFATSGKPVEYAQFNKIVNANIKEETQLITCIGNHEFISYRDEDPTVAYTVYKECQNEELDTHTVINGYHVIGVSYADDAKTFNGKLTWLRNELDKAVKDDPTKPIFVFQHPQPFGTVYGSVNWGTLQVRTVLEAYPQVIDFSGHSHYNLSDPRSIWQGTFTAVGTGSITTLQGNLNYLTGGEDSPYESGGFWIVEADKDGNVRLQAYDVVSHMFFENCDYYFSDITNLRNRSYTWGNFKSLDTAPEFPANAAIASELDSDNNTILSFADANGYYKAENYKIIVSKSFFNNVYEETVLSDYVRADSTTMTVNLGQLEAGTYNVKITPYSPFSRAGKALTGTITVE